MSATVVEALRQECRRSEGHDLAGRGLRRDATTRECPPSLSKALWNKGKVGEGRM